MATVAVIRITPDTFETWTAMFNEAHRAVVGKNGGVFKAFRTRPMSASEWLAGRVAKGWTPTAPLFPIKSRIPVEKTLRRWSFDGIAHATDGCKVEPDGTCPHGAPSWLLALGVI